MAALPWAIAIASAALMGLAIQRGATCMVAAVDDAISNRSFGRALALAEAAVWVGGLSALAEYAGLLQGSFARFPVGGGTLAGGVLLGLGAWINRACVFGSVARIGNGQVAWLATPVGFFLGCLVPLTRPAALGLDWNFPAPALLALAFIALFGWRVLQLLRATNVLGGLWEPYRATLMIALAFVTAMLAAGMWAYTDALDELARGSDNPGSTMILRSAMVVALFGGSALGGWLVRATAWQVPRPGDVTRCLIGGAMMGLGAALVPGSNDGLILLGLPLLLPHALLAVGVMAGTIALAITISRARA